MSSSTGKHLNFHPLPNPGIRVKRYPTKDGSKRATGRVRMQPGRSCNPDAVDGYLILADYAVTCQEAENLCIQAVAAAERLMGSKYR